METGNDLMMTAVKQFEKKQAGSKDAFFKKFCRSAELEHQDLTLSVKKLSQEAAERNTTSRKALEVHVTASLPKATTERSSSKRALPAAPGSSSSSDDLFSLATQQLEQAHHILATYDAACKLVAEAKFPEGELGEGWDTDFECVRELLELGQRVAQRQIDALAGAVSGEPLDGGEQFRVAAHLKMQQGGSNGSAVASFHDLLRDTERGVTRLTRGLPSDKEGC